MTPQLDVLALYENMRFELKTCSHQSSDKLPRNPKNLFGLILGTVKETRFLDDIDIGYIHDIASKVHGSNISSLQNMTFKFMRRLIHIFARAKLRHKRGHIVTELLRFYPDVVFPSSCKYELFSEASQHAVELCSIQNPYRVYALRAFDLDSFVNFPIDRFKSDAVENLLRVISEKVHSYTDLENSVPAAINFLSVVAETRDRCRCLIKVCSVLSQLLEVIANESLEENSTTILSSNIFQKALSHVTYPTKGRSCWEAIAQLMKQAFKFGNARTKDLLVDIGVFQKVLEMFESSRPEVIAQLLDFITEVCAGPDLLYINHALNNNLIVLVVPFVEYPPDATKIEQRASKALDTFFENAEMEQVFRGLDDGMLAAMVRLLKSKDEQVVINALKWLFVVIEKLEGATDLELLPKFKKLVYQAQGDEALLELTAHKKVSISRSAFITHEQFIGSPKRQTKLDEARRGANRKFILESVSI